MNDLISRQAAIDALEERIRANGYSNIGLISELNRSIGYLRLLPSAQKEGEWIKIKSDDGTICSNCGFTLEDWIQGIFYNFCPNCGAKMDGKVKE